MSLVLAHRRGGYRLVHRCLGSARVPRPRLRRRERLTEPWNPYLPLLWWVVLLLAVWSVVCGDFIVLPLAVFAASFCAQTHLPYFGLVPRARRARDRCAAAVVARRAPRQVSRAAPIRESGLSSGSRSVSPCGHRSSSIRCATTPGNISCSATTSSIRRSSRSGSVPASGSNCCTSTSRSSHRISTTTPAHSSTRRAIRTARSCRASSLLALWGASGARRAASDTRRLLRLHLVIGVVARARGDLDGADLRALVVLPDAVVVGDHRLHGVRHRLDGGGGRAPAPRSAKRARAC